METLMRNNNQHDSHQENHQKLAQQLFCVNGAYTSLTKEPHSKKSEDCKVSSTVVFNDIFQLIKGNSQAEFVKRSPELIKKINSDLSLRKIYTQLIKQLKFAESGLQAAASSGDALPERVTEHFSLKFKRDISQPSQVYVILTINHPAKHHLANTFAVHMTNEKQVDCLYFPILDDGHSQLLMEDEDSRFQLLTDPNSQLYLM